MGNHPSCPAMLRLGLALMAGVSAVPVAHERETEILSAVDFSVYSKTCMEAWRPFDAARCWCYTGCALDCTQGGSPGVPGNEVHPYWCGDHQKQTAEECMSLSCSMPEACGDAEAEQAPGLTFLAATGGYECPGAVATPMPDSEPATKTTKKSSPTVSPKETDPADAIAEELAAEVKAEVASAMAALGEQVRTEIAASMAGTAKKMADEITSETSDAIHKEAEAIKKIKKDVKK